MKLKEALALLVAAMCITSARETPAQAAADGPTALIISYHAHPGARAKFRGIMQTEGVPQFEKWRRDDVFASYQVFFTSYAADTVPDMFVVLRFNHFSDLWRWQRIEEKLPGGLPEDAQLLAAAETSATADIVAQNSVAATTNESQFFVLEYDVLVDMPQYASYVLGYAAPQFDAWEKTGALSSYAAFVNQNPAGAAWSGFILLEFKDLKSLAAFSPTWKKWSDDKSATSVEKAVIPVRVLNLP